MLLGVPSIGGAILALFVAVPTCAVWRWAHSGRFLTLTLALPGYIVLKLALGSGVSVIFGAVVFVMLSAVIGILRDLRQDA